MFKVQLQHFFFCCIYALTHVLSTLYIESTNFARVALRAMTTEFIKLVRGAESIVTDATDTLAEELDSKCA